MKSDHIEGHSTLAPVRTIPYTLRRILPASSCICISQSDSMVLSGDNFFRWNHLAPPIASHLCMKLRVACWISSHCCRSALNEPQPWNLYFATLGGYLSLCWPRALPNSSPVACWLVIPSSPPPEPRLHISSKTSQPTIAESIQHYRNFSKAARSRKSPTTCNCCLPVQGSILKLFQTVLSPDNWPMLLLQ